MLGACGATGIAAGLLASGCGRGKTRTTARSGGTLRVATAVPIASGLDPHIESGTGLRIFPRIYGYTHHINPDDDSLLLDQAESVEQPDGTTIVIKLRGDVRFHDIAPVSGRTVRASDVAASVERYRDNPLVVNKAWYAQILDRVEAPDDRTVIVRTKQPYAYSLHELGAVGSGAILPAELIAANTDLSAFGIGSGPFTLEETSGLEHARLARYAGYFRSALPYLDAMEWQVFDSNEAKVDAFLAGDAEEITNRDRTEHEEVLSASGDSQASAVPALGYLSLGLRLDRPPFNDARVREAVEWALDRDELIREMVGGDGDVLGPVNGHLAGGYWSLSDDEIAAAQGTAAPPEHRREQARAAISAAGAGTTPVALQVADHPQLIDVATLVRDQLGRVGLDVRLEPHDELTWYVNYRGGHFDATLISQPPYEWPDAPTRLYHSGGLDGTGSPFGFSDPAIDWLVARSWGEADRDQRRADARRSAALDAYRSPNAPTLHDHRLRCGRA